MISIAIITVMVSIAVKLWHDLRVHFNNLKNKTAIGINHKKEAAFMALANIPALVLFTLSSKLPFYLAAPLSLAMILFTVWNLFDGFYSVGKGKSWWYTGDTTYNGTAKTDSFLRGLKLWQHIAIKLIGMVGTIALYILTIS